MSNRFRTCDYCATASVVVKCTEILEEYDSRFYFFVYCEEHMPTKVEYYLEQAGLWPPV